MSIIVVPKSATWKDLLRAWFGKSQNKRRMPEDIEFTRVSPAYSGVPTPYFLQILAYRYENPKDLDIYVSRKLTVEEKEEMFTSGQVPPLS